MKRRALVVDDDAAIRILVTRVMSRNEYDVDAVRDGGEAIEKLLEHDYDVVVLDLMMPRIDGFHVVKYFLEKQPEKLQNVIVMTAFGGRAFEQVCPPIQRFIEKPFDIEKLLAEATECIAANAAVEPPPIEEPPVISPV
ncbi:MAG TPA: response regulator [Thermoanaerobaculia bacterium]|jgi:CheY-like chemotaxis protein